MRLALAVLLLAVTSCSKNTDDKSIPPPVPPPSVVNAPSASSSAALENQGPCPDAVVKVDGKPMKMASARAYGFVSNPATYVLKLSNKDVSCADLIAGYRKVTKDEDYADVGVGTIEINRYVTSDNERAKVKTELVTTPQKIGDPVAICVREPAHLETKMRKTSTIDVVGLIKGTYCGDTK